MDDVHRTYTYIICTVWHFYVYLDHAKNGVMMLIDQSLFQLYIMLRQQSSVIQKCTLLLYHISVLQIARVETEIAKSYVVRTLETILIYRGSSNLRGFHYCISHLCDFWLMYTANVYRTIIGQLSENAL